MTLATIEQIIPELRDALLGRRFGKVFVLSRHSIAIDLRLADSSYLFISVEPADPRLWLLLRSLDLPRESIARVGYSLSEADRRRDLERFADQLDIVMALTAVAATKATAALRLPPG